MAWIESHQKLKEDPKCSSVAAAMGWNIHECIGRLHCLWWWCVDHCEDGNLSRYNEAVIAGACQLPLTDAKQFVEAMVVGCGTPDAPDGFFERAPDLRLKNWWKFVRRFMQKRFEKTPAKWHAIARAYGSRDAEPAAGPTVDPAAGPTRARKGPAADRTNRNLNLDTTGPKKNRGGEGVKGVEKEGSAGGATPTGALSLVAKFPVPEFHALPKPLYPDTAKQLLDAVAEQIESIKKGARKTPIMQKLVDGTEVQIGNRLEEPALAAIAEWEKRRQQIKRQLAG